MEDGGAAQVRWGTAIGLSVAVVLLSALDVVALLTLPLAVILLAVPFTPRWKWLAAGLLLWLLGVSFPGGELGSLSRGWAFLLGGSYLAITLWRPRWGVLPRALVAVAMATGGAAAWVGLTAGWSEIDERVRLHLDQVATTATAQLATQAEGSAWVEQLTAAARGMAELQWTLFPALVALQSLAALALASWVISRIRRGDAGPFQLRPLREFRFNDQLVWVVIAGLALLVLPLSAIATRLGWNALLFMGGLYALRGFGIFLFLTGGAPTFFGIVIGAIALLFVYPLVLATAVVVGLVDTWLDLRARAATAPPP